MTNCDLLLTPRCNRLSGETVAKTSAEHYLKAVTEEMPRRTEFDSCAPRRANIVKI